MEATNNITKAYREKAFTIEARKTVGQRLQQARAAKGLTLEQAAIAAGVTANNIHCYEQGSPAPPDVLIKLTSEVYRCSLHEILHSSTPYP
ncbi:MAG: helix-turn-helix transcriptional regulator [Chloroflexi bacterium]|nr:helix-turn-helix transcriptional regulator [Chloroflexota bacterium]